MAGRPLRSLPAEETGVRPRWQRAVRIGDPT